MSDQLSDFDPTEQMTDLDSHGHAADVKLDRHGQPSGHGMEEVSCRI